MAKINGLFGAMSGKVADVVMTSVNGVQIVRKYQPYVSNPSTSKQVSQRARLKLMSQLAAVFAPVIAIPKVGIVSARNRFSSLNFPQSYFEDGVANINLEGVKITKSVVALPNLTVTRGQAKHEVSLAASAIVNLSRVVYVQFTKTPDNLLNYYGSVVVSTAGTSNTFPGELPFSAYETVVYAYGVRDNTESAKATFGDLTAVTAEDVAKLVVSSVLTAADITVTETRSATLNAQSA